MKEKERLRFCVSPLVFVFAAVMFLLGKGFALISYFIAVVMHEMAHAEVARRRGYSLVRVKIMPYGASLTGAFEGVRCKDEVAIALAGPLSNICIAVVCTALWWLAPVTYFFTEPFVLANVFTALTNVLPIFPLDGGRAVLALLSCKLPRQKAYKIVRIFGYAACAAFTVLFSLSLWYGVNFTFALMALFVLNGTLVPDKNSKYQRLYSMAFRSEKLKHGLLVRETMVASSLTLHALTGMLSGSYYQRFTVVNERLEQVATVTETELERYLAQYAPQTPLSQVLRLSR